MIFRKSQAYRLIKGGLGAQSIELVVGLLREASVYISDGVGIVRAGVWKVGTFELDGFGERDFVGKGGKVVNGARFSRSSERIRAVESGKHGMFGIVCVHMEENVLYKGKDG